MQIHQVLNGKVVKVCFLNALHLTVKYSIVFFAPPDIPVKMTHLFLVPHTQLL